MKLTTAAVSKLGPILDSLVKKVNTLNCNMVKTTRLIYVDFLKSLTSFMKM